MTDRPDTTPSRRRHLRRVRYAATGVAAAFLCGAAVLYGLGGVGNSAAACPMAKAETARLDPLVHGEVAAFGLGDPARLAPALSFNGPDGKPVSLADFKGKTVLLNMWATWCIPCRKEMPALDRLEGKLGGPDFQVVAVNVDTARLDRPKAFLADTGVKSLAFYADPTADVLQKLKANGELLGLPTTLLVDKNGCELGRMAGPADWASPDAEKLIEAAKG
ncbi:MAG TPA: TlpA disulfide reductase family protein [Lichenihabitans sp.]|jgi:thiol-disulfide isomerase/thioredoxin|nr:TlpA disulfide reductase family protein [Lichenihabitans sp.]